MEMKSTVTIFILQRNAVESKFDAQAYHRL